MYEERTAQRVHEGLNEWLDKGPGYAYEFSMLCEDDYGAQMVNRLRALGYNTQGERRQIVCNCATCNGAARPSTYYTITVTR